jgi:nicotinate phosphoribosyltransferase
MGVSRDVPSLDIVYKLVSYAGTGRIKLSAEKTLIPGPKQIFRMERDGVAEEDVLGCSDEPATGRPLLQPVMKGGVRLSEGRVTLEGARTRARAEVGRLPPHIRSIEPARSVYPVTVSEALIATRDAVRRKHQA